MEDDPILSDVLGVGLYSGSINIYVSGRHCLFDQTARPGQVP
jgi:hypothetical protein